MTYMLDTNICIYAIKNKPEQVLRRLHGNLNKGLCISTITLAELVHGTEKSENPEKNRTALLQFLSILDILPFDAGHARAEGLVLVTNNVREFERVPNLEIENWAEDVKL